jgi:branched-chain amino acid transport system substrate-binding protein
MRVRIAAVAAIGLVGIASVVSACSNNTRPSGGQHESLSGPIKIGVVLELTGAAAPIAGPERNAISLALKQIKAINGRKVEATILDAQSREDEAAKAMGTLVDQDHVDLVIGSTRSGPSLAMRPIAERAQVPMIGLAASDKIVSGARWVFKTPPSDRVVIAQLTAYFASKGYRRIGLLRDASAFGEGVSAQIDSSGKAAGIHVVDEEKFAPDATDFTASLVRLRDAKADATVIWGSAAAPALATKAYRQLGLKAPLIESYGVASQQFLATAGDAANGVVLNGNKLLVVDRLAANDPQKKVLTGFVDAYKAAYHQPPTPFAGYAYDAVELAADALRAVGTDRNALRGYLERRHGYVGVTGVFNFSATEHSGFAESPLLMLSVSGGTFQVLGRA